MSTFVIYSVYFQLIVTVVFAVVVVLKWALVPTPRAPAPGNAETTTRVLLTAKTHTHLAVVYHCMASGEVSQITLASNGNDVVCDFNTDKITFMKQGTYVVKGEFAGWLKQGKSWLIKLDSESIDDCRTHPSSHITYGDEQPRRVSAGFHFIVTVGYDAPAAMRIVSTLRGTHVSGGYTVERVG